MSIPIYDSKQMQLWDQFTIKNEPIDSIDLMERAASLATKVILGNHSFQSVAIFCGPGNNGGDGLVIARLLQQQNKSVHLYLLRFGKDSEDFKKNYDNLPKGIKIRELTEEDYSFSTDADLIVDAIFGSGLDRPVKGWIGKVIDQMNMLSGKKVAIDIPSGLFANDNYKQIEESNVFEVNQTLTFMAPKMSFFFSTYNNYVGDIRILDIGLHEDFQGEKIASYLTAKDVHLKKRNTFDHKNKNGVLTLIAGFEEMNGAAIISSMAAMKTGCGYLYTVSDKRSHAPLNSTIPEAIWQDSNSFELSPKTRAIAIGPGLGTGDLPKSILTQCLKSGLPIVLDADAINLISKDDSLLKLLPKDAILTPHIGEMKSLIGDFKYEEELLNAQVEFSKKYNVHILQKGAYSKITTAKGEIFVNSSGNPGMGTAGMGDALTGIIGSFLAQGYSAEQSLKYGTYIHGYAADRLFVDVGPYGWNASEVIRELPHTINSFLR